MLFLSSDCRRWGCRRLFLDDREPLGARVDEQRAAATTEGTRAAAAAVGANSFFWNFWRRTRKRCLVVSQLTWATATAAATANSSLLSTPLERYGWIYMFMCEFVYSSVRRAYLRERLYLPQSAFHRCHRCRMASGGGALEKCFCFGTL